MQEVRDHDLVMQAHDRLMEEIRLENERIDARMELYPAAVFGGDGTWNNYGESPASGW